MKLNFFMSLKKDSFIKNFPKFNWRRLVSQLIGSYERKDERLRRNLHGTSRRSEEIELSSEFRTAKRKRFYRRNINFVK